MPGHTGLALRTRSLVLLCALQACAVAPTGPGDVVDTVQNTPDPTDDTDDTVDVTPRPVIADAVARRLSRDEYARSVHDLLGVDVPPEALPPADAETRGFANQGDALDIPTVALEAYETAAAAAAERALRRPPSSVHTALALDPDSTVVAWQVDGDPLDENGWGGVIDVPEAGVWRFDYALGRVVAGETTSATAYVDDVLVDTWTVPGAVGRWAASVEVALTAGVHTFAVAAPLYGQEPLTLDAPTATGPVGGQARAALVPCDLDADTVGCARQVLTTLAPRALRAPVSDTTLDRLVTLVVDAVAGGAGPDEALGTALRALLLHPRFLFHVEPDGDPSVVAPGPRRALDAWELAARLAATVWVSIPDARLASLAASGDLLDATVLDAEVRRMLADPRADALADVFLTDWLDLDTVASLAPDPSVFPDVDPALRDGMVAEVQALLRDSVTTDLASLLTTTQGVVTPRLAAHYGLPDGASGRVDLSAVGRGGLLGTAGALAVLSHPDRTSPTRRGKFVLDRLLCRPPDPPPPNIPPLPDGGTVADRLAAHTDNPACSGCHASMDALGHTLDGFDGVGAAVTGAPDVTGTLPDGTAITGLAGLRAYVVADPDFRPCAATQLVTWALGREPGADQDAVDAVVTALSAPDGSLADAVVALVHTDAFRSHRSAP